MGFDSLNHYFISGFEYHVISFEDSRKLPLRKIFSAFSQIQLRKSRYTYVRWVKTEALAITSAILGSKRISIEQGKKDVSAKNYYF
jgi:hypothetical protein